MGGVVVGRHFLTPASYGVVTTNALTSPTLLDPTIHGTYPPYQPQCGLLNGDSASQSQRPQVTGTLPFSFSTRPSTTALSPSWIRKLLPLKSSDQSGVSMVPVVAIYEVGPSWYISLHFGAQCPVFFELIWLIIVELHYIISTLYLPRFFYLVLPT